MTQAFLAHLRAGLDETGASRPDPAVKPPRHPAPARHPAPLRLCCDDVLGLGGDPRVAAASRAALDTFGFGMAAVRTIEGARLIHRDLERAVAAYLGTEDAVLFSGAYGANMALFDALFDANDVVVVDSLTHGSVMDGLRLGKAKALRFAHRDMTELEDRLKQATRDGARFKVVATDGVFAVEGDLAPLGDICAVAERYDALVVVNDADAVGHLGPQGRGSVALAGVEGRVDLVTGTFGKALGGGIGSYVAAAQPVVDVLRRRARPYLLPDPLPPAAAAGAAAALALCREAEPLRARLRANQERFRAGLTQAGFELIAGQTSVVSVLVQEAGRARAMADALAERSILVTSVGFPAVPMGRARLRCQLSAVLGPEEIDRAVAAFAEAGRALQLL